MTFYKKRVLIVGIVGISFVLVISMIVLRLIQKNQLEEKAAYYESWFEHTWDNLKNDPDLDRTIATVGEESITFKDLWVEAMITKIYMAEADPKIKMDSSLQGEALQAAFNELIKEAVFTCYARDQHIAVDKNEAEEWHRMIIEVESQPTGNADIMAAARIQKKYPELFRKKWVRSYAQKVVDEIKTEQEGGKNQSPDQRLKIHSKIFREAFDTCEIMMTQNAPPSLTIPDYK